MSKKSLKVRMGHIVVVDNTKRKFGSNKLYNLVKLQYPSGKECYCMFTENQLLVARSRVTNNPEDLVKSLGIVDLLD